MTKVMVLLQQLNFHMAHPCSRKAMVENLKRKLWGNTDISFKKDPFELDNLYYIKSVQCALQK